MADKAKKTNRRHVGRGVPRHSVATVDSGDELDIYDYTQSRYDTRKPDKSTRKPLHQNLEGVGHQHHEQTRTAVGDDDDQDSSDESDDDHRANDETDDDDEGQDLHRHPYYNYSTEKADVHADSKLIYHRHRMDTRSESESGGSPFLLGKSLTSQPESYLDGAGMGMAMGLALGRSASLSSRRSRQGPKKINVASPPSGVPPGKEMFPSLEDHTADQKTRRQDLASAADVQARDHSHHPELPHEHKDALLLGQNVHGAGAGVGIGEGPGGLARADTAIVTEVEAVCDKIQHILDLRQAYLKVSLQCPGDNPKDDPDWHIYPAPPEPVWHEEKHRSQTLKEEGGPNSASSSIHISDPKPSSFLHASKWGSTTSMAGMEEQTPVSPTTARKRRKAGTNIGEDFDFSQCEIPGKAVNSLTFGLDSGSVYQVYDDKEVPIVNVPTLRDYYIALDQILDIASDGPAKSFAYRRLQYLEGRYNLYTLLNEYEEVSETKKVPHRDFYNVRKVDTHVHHSACMNQKHLLRFIKSKMKKCPDDIVIDRDGKQLTLQEVFESINLTAYDLSIDTLDMHAHTDSFHRFDKFNLKYNPIGQSRLRDIFLKTDNFIQGRYLAEITREVIADLESSKYQMAEWRISIYGRDIEEWDKLAAWVVDNKLMSNNVRWLIQIPRLFALYKAVNNMDNFEELVRNIFQPLFEVTMDPSTHPKLHVFLQRVIGFDSVDDESKVERRFYRKFPSPKDWNTKQNPPYGYWIYYLFANMTSLNAWRKRRGFNTFVLRPHCGEAGDTDHLATAILCCHSISHGIMLRKVPLLQYVFYLDQIGIAMSPLSNNALFLTYDRNPFISYFKKGLNVSLSTDDPLQFAFTKEPLIEEYSVAAQIYKLSAIDMCELAKHSVDQCGFELQLKQRWLGNYCYLPGVLGNDVRKANVPNIREAFRHETLKGELKFIAEYTQDYSHLKRCSPTLPVLHETSVAAGEVHKSLESPRTWFTSVADSIVPAQAARHPDHYRAHDLAPLTKQISPKHKRTQSRSSTFSTSKPNDHEAPHTGMRDLHLSGSEPRAFPGLVHRSERNRRNSFRQSISSSTREGSVTGEQVNLETDPSPDKYRSGRPEGGREMADNE